MSGLLSGTSISFCPIKSLIHVANLTRKLKIHNFVSATNYSKFAIMVSLFLFLSQLPVGFLCDPKMSPITVHVPCTGKTIIIIIILVLAYILMHCMPVIVH